MSKRIVITIGMAAALSGLSACASQEASLPSAVTTAFEEALAADDPEAAAALFTEDGELLTQERPVVKGRDELRSYIADQMNPVIMFDATTTQSIVRNDLAVEIGSYTFRDTRRGSDTEYGKYIVVWKQVAGEWKVYRAMYNTDEPIDTQVSISHAEAG